MTTYNTYQEAKIANPESNIYIHTGEFWCEKSIRPSSWTYESRGFKLCNPADYCMTVERFLSSGHKFVKSDVVFDFGDVVSIDTEFDVETYNKTDKMDDRRYILRAAALEGKKPRTKVEWIDVHHTEAVYYFTQTDDDMYAEPDESQKYDDLQDYINNLEESGSSSLYRRIETPMTEREELVESVEKIGAELTENGDWSFACLAAEIFDRKLVK